MGDILFLQVQLQQSKMSESAKLRAPGLGKMEALIMTIVFAVTVRFHVDRVLFDVNMNDI